MEINFILDEEFQEYLDSSWLYSIAEQVITIQSIGNNIEMGLVITTQERIQELNKKYRGKDTPTDVLSFTMLPESVSTVELGFINPPDGIKHLGEVIISYPQAIKQAEEHGHSMKRELAILVIHGVLHLLGYDHIEDKQAQDMEAKEAAVLRSIKGGLD